MRRTEALAHLGFAIGLAMLLGCDCGPRNACRTTAKCARWVRTVGIRPGFGFKINGGYGYGLLTLGPNTKCTRWAPRP